MSTKKNYSGENSIQVYGSIFNPEDELEQQKMEFEYYMALIKLRRKYNRLNRKKFILKVGNSNLPLSLRKSLLKEISK